MNLPRLIATTLLAALPAVPAQAAEPLFAGSQPVSQAELDRGRYLVRVGGCNDCHTAGYAASYGGVEERDWLLGDDTAFRGRWGTTFATNLRLSLLRFTDAQWLTHARALQTRAPMPAERLHAMSDADLLALLHYVQWLGPRGEPAPQPLPPGEDWIGLGVDYVSNGVR